MSWPPTSLTATQLANARIIVGVGQRLGASQRDIQIALMTAMQESELLNMAGGDRDSTGLFQQRDAWGTYSDRMDPYRSAAMFFQGGHDGQRGLLDFKARDQMSLTAAAQAVQGSAYPNAYAKWESLAAKYLPELGGGQAPSGVSERTGAQAPVAGQPVTPATVTPSTHTVTSANTASPSPSYAPAVPGAAVMTAPGAQAVTTAPGAEDAVQHMLTPSTPPEQGTMDEASFHQMFPDAAATKMFSGAANGTASNARRGDVVSTAMSYLGTPYVWGGNGRGGVDCSGLVQQVYGHFGVNVPRLSAEQIRAGQRVSYNSLRPGDLIGWDLNSRNNGADHIAIYAGNGYIIEAPRPGLAVRRRQLGPHEIATAMGTHFAQLG